jgi:hypothetical protein
MTMKQKLKNLFIQSFLGIVLLTVVGASCTNHQADEPRATGSGASAPAGNIVQLTDYTQISRFNFSENLLSLGWKQPYPTYLTGICTTGEYVLVARSFVEISDASGTLDKHPAAILILDPSNGSLIATIDVGESDLGSLTVIDNERCAIVATKQGDSRVILVNIRERKIDWTSESLVNESALVSVASGPVVLSMHQNKLVAIAIESGKTLWTANVSSQPVPPSTHPNGSVFTVSSAGKLQCLDVRNGTEKWSSLVNAQTPPAVFKDRLVCFNGQQFLVVNALDGKVERQLDSIPEPHAFACSPDGRYLVSGHQGTQFLNQDGTVQWTIKESFSGFVTNATVALGIGEESLSLIDLQSGTITRTLKLDDEYLPPVVTSGGSLHSATVEGTVIQIK